MAEPLPGAVILGDPLYERDPTPEPRSPETGALIAQAVSGGNAAGAGLRRGDVILDYDGKGLEAGPSLRDAVAAVEEAIEKGERPGDEPVALRYWRAGEVKEARLPPGKLGVQLFAASPASGLRSLERQARGESSLTAEVSATDQVRIFGGRLASLAGTRSEALSVAEVFRKAGIEPEVLLGEDATYPRLAKAAGGRGFLHLATHGLLGSAERPHDASLALTRPKELRAEDIGFLRLDDLLRTWGGKLEGCRLVVLSACNTQRGIDADGESVMALPWGFFFAGARTVVASLWEVDDEATSLLMERFYESLLGVFKEPREAGGARYEGGSRLPVEAALLEAKDWLRRLGRDDAEAATARLRALRRVGTKAQTTKDGIPGTSPDRGPGQEVTRPQGTTRGTGRPYGHPYFWAAFVCVGSPE